MKGVVSLRDLQSGQVSAVSLHMWAFPILDFCKCSELNLAIQAEQKVWGFQQGLSLSFVFSEVCRC